MLLFESEPNLSLLSENGMRIAYQMEQKMYGPQAMYGMTASDLGFVSFTMTVTWG